MAAITRTEGVTLTRADIAGPLAALRRLAGQDAVADGKDPVPLVVAELGDCLEGRLPLAYGEALLNDWASDWWTPGNLARLRVLWTVGIAPCPPGPLGWLAGILALSDDVGALAQPDRPESPRDRSGKSM